MTERKVMWTRDRRARRKQAERQRSNGSSTLNTYLTTIIAAVTLAIAFAQWRTSEKQADIANSLRELEFAKADAKFEIKLSDEVEIVKTGLTSRSVSLPRTVAVHPTQGVRDIRTIDVPVLAELISADGKLSCTVTFRGIYLNGNGYSAHLWTGAMDEFKNMLMHLEARGLYIIYNQPLVRVTYIDLLDAPETKTLNREGGERGIEEEISVPIYSGAWSNGKGFYVEPGDARKLCPDAANLLISSVRETGGHAGRTDRH